MIVYMEKRRFGFIYRLLSAFIAVSFVFCSVIPSPGFAQSIAMLNLPVPGTMVTVSPAFVPVLLKGMTIHPEDPLKFNFIVDSGNTAFDKAQVEAESQKLIKYFLVSMTVPKDDLWVNLSPYEDDRIIPEELGKTELGRDLLAQDYILKQLTASLMYPEDELGSEFWKRIYEKAESEYGVTDIPVDTFNKVWILPEQATVYENGNTVYVVDSKLKVMLDSDYVAMTNDNRLETKDQSTMEIGESIVRELIIPEIEKEVNEGKNFAPLRQIYHSLILAKWYKETIKNSILSEVYVDRNKMAGVELDDKAFKEEIYEQYMEAYKKGVFDFIKEDYDELSQEVIPRKYFSGGFKDSSMLTNKTSNKDAIRMSVVGETFDVELGITAQKDGQAVNLPSFENEEYPTREMFMPGEILQFDDIEGGILLVADNGGDKSALSIKLIEQMQGLKVLSAGSSNIRWVDRDGGKTLIGSRRTDSPVINSRALGPKTVALTQNTSANVRWILDLDGSDEDFMQKARTQGIQVVDLSDLDVYSQLDEIVDRVQGAVDLADNSMLSEAFREKFELIKASQFYDTSIEVSNGQEILTITDKTTDSSFSVVPGFGFKVHSLIVNGHTIYRPAADVVGSGGQVIMSPWVGRLQNGQFEYDGRLQDVNELESVKIDGGTGYPKDGLVRNQKWVLEDTGVDFEGAYIRASIDSADHPDILEHFGRSKLTMTIHISAEDVFYDVEIENLDDKKVYNAVGLHEYGISTNRSTTLELNAGSVLDADEKGIPTGGRIAVDSQEQEHLNFNDGNIVAAGAVDRTYTDVETDEQGRWQAIVTDAERKIRRTYLVDGEMFQYPHIWSGNTDSYADITSVEFLTDAPNGINNPNSKSWLNPGEKRKGRIHMHVETDVKVDSAMLSETEARSLIEGKLDSKHHHLINNYHVQEAIRFDGKFRVVYHEEKKHYGVINELDAMAHYADGTDKNGMPFSYEPEYGDIVDDYERIEIVQSDSAMLSGVFDRFFSSSRIDQYKRNRDIGALKQMLERAKRSFNYLLYNSISDALNDLGDDSGASVYVEVFVPGHGDTYFEHYDISYGIREFSNNDATPDRWKWELKSRKDRDSSMLGKAIPVALIGALSETMASASNGKVVDTAGDIGFVDQMITMAMSSPEATISAALAGAIVVAGGAAYWWSRNTISGNLYRLSISQDVDVINGTMKWLSDHPDDKAFHEIATIADNHYAWESVQIAAIKSITEMIHKYLMDKEYYYNQTVEILKRQRMNPKKSVSKAAKNGLEKLGESGSDSAILSDSEEKEKSDFVMLISTGEEANGYDGYNGSHTVTQDEKIVIREEAIKQRGQYAYNLLGGTATYDYRELTEEERIHVKSSDKAQLSDPDVGGIDMNGIEVERTGNGVEIQFDEGAFDPLLKMGIDGFVPVIINVTPINNIMMLLGLEPKRDDDEETIELSKAE